MYEVDNGKGQVMTVFKVALVNLVMGTRDLELVGSLFPSARDSQAGTRYRRGNYFDLSMTSGTIRIWKRFVSG
ncbi:hypothetical protein EPA93_32570 [Ktedonosporobacter rubrisoli]|uniref:Uncharacterized protein n=1 Tax=Ktedonosporobacter rubrisoli TaxID=2509675 RepID=A0A4P6JYB2_KTERU|nr:hypothetical protein [Ktedonosporobacter rubrisoli]QBD80453.1 hypothetical protein EPA93_32570 [Ktedonosporobacter rubrisoli]